MDIFRMLFFIADGNLLTCLGNRKVELIMSGFVFGATHEKLFLDSAFCLDGAVP